MRPIVIAALLGTIITLSACQITPPAIAAPVHGFVVDTDAFHAFIATHPTPEQFRAAYPDVQLVMPGGVATREFRQNNSRYFAELDEQGRIIGGHFG